MTNKKLIYISLLCVALIIGSIFLTLTLHWADFHVYHTAGHSLLSGRTDLYAPTFADGQIMDYRYPLFFLIVFLPFCWLPYQAAEFVWLWLNIAIIYLTVVVIKRGFQMISARPIRVDLIFLLSFLICAKYFIVSMRILNVHIIMLCLIFGAFYLLLKQKQFLASFLMALAITFKIVPILTLPYFALKKQWLFVAMTVVFVVVFNLLPALHFGFNLNLQMLNDWYQHVMVNNEFHNINGPINVSLEGQLERYLTEIDYTKRIEDPSYPKVNLVSLPENYVSAISKISALLMLSASLFLIWFAAKSRKRIGSTNLDWEKDADDDFRNGHLKTLGNFDFLAYHEFGLVICLMLLVEPRSNVYYFLALFFPLIPFLDSLFHNRSKFNILAFVIILILACALPLIPGSYNQRLLLVLGVDFYITLVLWIALGYNIIREGMNREK